MQLLEQHAGTCAQVDHDAHARLQVALHIGRVVHHDVTCARPGLQATELTQEPGVRARAPCWGRTGHVLVHLRRARLPGAVANAQRSAHGRLRQIVVQAREVVAQRPNALLQPRRARLLTASTRRSYCQASFRRSCRGAEQSANSARWPRGRRTLRTSYLRTASLAKHMLCNCRAHSRKQHPCKQAGACMAGDVHIKVAGSQLDGAHHRLLADKESKVAERAERKGVARSNQEAADRVYLLARHTVNAVNKDTGPACTRAAGSL